MTKNHDLHTRNFPRLWIIIKKDEHPKPSIINNRGYVYQPLKYKNSKMFT